MSTVPTVPSATYRLNFGPQFTFRNATAIVPYLHDLGISHVYASPFLKARPDSTHGYDVTDHNALNPTLGSAEDFAAFSDTLRTYGMGLILDFVPNHMSIGHAANELWLDVLEWGQSSIYADFFDIDWMPRQIHLRGKVLIPLLRDQYGFELEAGKIELRFDHISGTFSAWYYEDRFPIRSRHYAIAIRRQLAVPAAVCSLEKVARSELERFAAEFDKLRRPGWRLRAVVRAHARALQAELAEYCARDQAVADFLAASAAAFNGEPGRPESFLALHCLLERQVYRLAFWRVAADEINYRRFFNINDLAGIRMERREVFERTHQLVGRLISDGKLHGIRLDHIDGMFDPRAYCRQLQAFVRARLPASNASDTPPPFYIVAEKILARHETLPDDWPVAGTTGYEFANLVNGIFLDPNGQPELERIYAEFIGYTPSFDATLAEAKNLVIDNLLPSEINALANALDRIADRHWGTRDFTGDRLRVALKAIAAHFPVYRTYVTASGPTAADRRDIDWAVGEAKRDWQGPDVEILNFVRAALTLDLVRRGGPYHRADVLRFAMKFQQYTSPVMAKSLEDTSFYRHNLLLSLNEVGGDPRQFGTSAASFHHANQQRAQRWPHSLLTTATHDTKRGEDLRTRLDVLSEIPELWNRNVRRWARLNRAMCRDVAGGTAPSRNDEYAIYQTLLGVWPPTQPDGPHLSEDAAQHLADRVTAYMIKAVREARHVSNWESPNIAYEDAVHAFIARLLHVARPSPFLSEFAAFSAQVAYLGMLNSLGQLVLKLTLPGLPDIYQGTEFWDLSLVDPDNRRAIDFAYRHRALAQLGSGNFDQVAMWLEFLAQWHDGRIKLALTQRLLRLRGEMADLFSGGSYEPLGATGEKAEHALAFLRRHGTDRIIVVVGRLFASLLGPDAAAYSDHSDWNDTHIVGPGDIEGEWTNLLTGCKASASRDGDEARLALGEILSIMPVAVLAPSAW